MIPCKPTGFAVTLILFFYFKSRYFIFLKNGIEKQKMNILTIKIITMIKTIFNENHRIKRNKNVRENHPDGQKQVNWNWTSRLEIG